VLAGSVLSLLWFPVASLAFGMRTMVVTGGSMEPTASAGDALVLERIPTSAVHAGDMITFKPLHEGGLRTHRVVSVHDVEGEGIHFRTKGDANPDFDPNLVPARNVLGRVVVRLPAVGRAYVFAKSGPGRLVLIVLPALLLIYRELRWIFAGRRGPPKRSHWRAKSVRRLRLRAGTIAGVAAVTMALAGPTAALFTDTVPVGSNTFSSGQVDPPTLTNLTAGLLPCTLVLTWTAPSTGLTPDGYDVLRATTSGGPYSLVTHVGAVTTLLDTSLGANTTYFYVVQSTLQQWKSGGSNQLSATTALVCV
jgi:signal peptidase